MGTKHDVLAAELDATAEARTVVGYIQAYKHDGSVRAVSVAGDQEGADDAQWNVELDGTDLFAAEQSVAATNTAEQFQPDQNQDAHDTVGIEVAVDVSTSSATGGSVLNLGLLWEEI